MKKSSTSDIGGCGSFSTEHRFFSFTSLPEMAKLPAPGSTKVSVSGLGVLLAVSNGQNARSRTVVFGPRSGYPRLQPRPSPLLLKVHSQSLGRTFKARRSLRTFLVPPWDYTQGKLLHIIPSKPNQPGNRLEQGDSPEGLILRCNRKTPGRWK